MSPEPRPGQRVQLLAGSFRDFIGAVAEVKPAAGKVRVTLSVFNKPLTVELGLIQVKLV